MKILVSIKRVPDPYGKIRLGTDGQIDESEIKWVVNPFDEIAIEEAVRIRENGVEAEIVVIAIGGPAWQDQIRAALAMGADRGIHVLNEGPADPSMIARIIAEVCRREQPDLILMGKQAIDDDFSQTGPMLAAHLGIPQATFASSIALAEDRATATIVREVDAGRETLKVTLPAVITADLRLNEPRYVALPAIIKARSKPIEQIEPAQLGAHPSPQISVAALESPPPRKAGRKVGSVGELLAALRDEAKVM